MEGKIKRRAREQASGVGCWHFCCCTQDVLLLLCVIQIASLLKLYLRRLDEPLLTFDLHPVFAVAVKGQKAHAHSHTRTHARTHTHMNIHMHMHTQEQTHLCVIIEG